MAFENQAIGGLCICEIIKNRKKEHIIKQIAIIDADLIGKSKHRFPNLACMKISGYHKELGDNVVLRINYNDLDYYDTVYISKVFTDVNVPEDILSFPNVKYGGTGFFYDKADPLPDIIEHHMPDYNLYNDWVRDKIESKIKSKEDKNNIILSKKEIKKITQEFEYYLDYSIGFTTRKCFRGCEFCVNRNYKKVELHSPLEEFYDPRRKYICLLDDNILGHPKWKDIILKLKSTNRYFQYKQGMDERIMTEEKAQLLNSCKYRGDYIFAFDNIEDRKIITEKMHLWKKYCTKTTKLYVFCGFDRNDRWGLDFWEQDIIDVFERIKILMECGCLPYIMRFNRYEESPYRGMYINLARWCNQPSQFKKKSFREFCESNGEDSSTMEYLNDFKLNCPETANTYFDLKFEKLNKYK